MNDAEMNEGVDCTQARMHFALLLYGELSFDEEERVETHLDGCVDCRATLDRQKALHAAFDGLAVEPPPSLPVQNAARTWRPRCAAERMRSRPRTGSRSGMGGGTASSIS